MSKSLTSQRAKAAEAARKKRGIDRERRRITLDAVAFGHSYETVAKLAGVSVSTVRRQVRRAIAARPPEPAETFVALHQLRLNKALQSAHLALEGGDIRAIAALVALTPHLERYWGLQTALRAARDGAESAHILAPNLMKTLETETHFAPPLGELGATPEGSAILTKPSSPHTP